MTAATLAACSSIFRFRISDKIKVVWNGTDESTKNETKNALVHEIEMKIEEENEKNNKKLCE